MPARRDPFAETVWARDAQAAAPGPAQRDTAAGSTLSREQIVAGAIRLLDSDGPTGLSMRRLGAALGAGATSLYWYVANKDELLDLAMDQVMAEVAAPEAAADAWRDAIAEYARSLRAMVVRHPWLTTVVGVRPNVGPNWTQLSDWMLGVLTAAGFTDLDAGNVGSAVSAYALGTAIADAASQRLMTESGLTGEEIVDRMREFFEASAGKYPHLERWMRENTSYEVDRMREEAFEFGLQRHLDGMAGWLERRPV